MRRREVVIGGLLGIGVAPSVAAQSERMRRVGVLTGLTADDPATKARLAAFREALGALGWAEGRNLRIDTRFAPAIETDAATLVAQLLALDPEVLVVQAPGMAAAWAATKTVPIIFLLSGNAVEQGWVESLAHPGGNVTGFTSNEPGFGPKWLQLLTEIAPDVRRVLVVEVLRTDPGIAAAGPQFGVEVAAPVLRSPKDIETAITEFARTPNGGLIVPTDAYTSSQRQLIIDLAMLHRLPLVSGNSPFPEAGGLLYYGSDTVDIYRRSAAYVDRILKGAKPADLPVQQPTKFNLVINLKTARALGLTVPQLLLAQADDVIE